MPILFVDIVKDSSSETPAVWPSTPAGESPVLACWLGLGYVLGAPERDPLRTMATNANKVMSEMSPREITQ
jgi:hypothetical protein